MKRSTWNDLSMRERAAYIKAGVNNGIYDLNTIRNSYNSFAEGGPLDDGGPLSSYKNSSGNYIFDNNKDVLALSKYMSNNGLYINSADRDSRGWAGVRDNDGLIHYVSPTIENKLKSIDPSFVMEDLPRVVVTAYLARDEQGKILRNSDGTPISFDSAEEREKYYTRRRLDNYVRTMKNATKYLDENNPEWRKTYGMTPDMETLNAVTGGVLNAAMPSWYLGNIANAGKAAFMDNYSWNDFSKGFVMGNKGANEIPGMPSFLGNAINFTSDFLAPMAAAPGSYKALTSLPNLVGKGIVATGKGAVKAADALGTGLVNIYKPRFYGSIGKTLAGKSIEYGSRVGNFVGREARLVKSVFKNDYDEMTRLIDISPEEMALSKGESFGRNLYNSGRKELAQYNRRTPWTLAKRADKINKEYSTPIFPGSIATEDVPTYAIDISSKRLKDIYGNNVPTDDFMKIHNNDGRSIYFEPGSPEIIADYESAARPEIRTDINGKPYARIIRQSPTKYKDRFSLQPGEKLPDYMYVVKDPVNKDAVTKHITEELQAKINNGQKSVTLTSLRDPNKSVTVPFNGEHKVNIDGMGYAVSVDKDGAVKVLRASGETGPASVDVLHHESPVFTPATGDEANAARTIVKDDLDYVRQRIPGYEPYGSTTTFTEAGTPQLPNDIDGFISRDNFTKFVQNNPNVKVRPSGKAGHFEIELSPGAGDRGTVEVSVVDVDPQGNPSGFIDQVYARLYPKEYKAQLDAIELGKNNYGQILMLDENGNVLTAQQILDKYRTTGNAINTIADSFVADITKTTKNQTTAFNKHASRPFMHIAHTDKQNVRDAINLLRNYLLNGKEPARVFPKLTFGTAKENADLLRSIGFPERFIDDIAKDPERMQLALDFSYLGGGGSYSRNASLYKIGQPGRQAKHGKFSNYEGPITEWNTTDAGSPGGSWQGAFMNTTTGKSTFKAPLTYFIQPKINGLYEGMPASEAVKLVLRSSGHPNYAYTGAEKKIINNILKKHGITPSRDYKNGPELLGAIPSEGTAVKAAGQEIAKKLDIYAFSGPSTQATSAGSGRFAGIARKMNYAPGEDVYGVGYYDRYAGLPFEIPNSYEEAARRARGVGTNGIQASRETAQIDEPFIPIHQQAEKVPSPILDETKYSNIKDFARKLYYKNNNINHNLLLGSLTGASAYPLYLATKELAEQAKERRERRLKSKKPRK